MDLMLKFKNELREKVRTEESNLEANKAKLRITKLKEAEAALANELAPNLDDPELQKLIAAFELCPFYERLDDFQIEDVVWMLDRWNKTKDQKPDPGNLFLRGIINANDTGMGKTVETLAFLWVMRQINPSARIVWFTAAALVKETAPEASTKWGFDMIPVFGSAAERINLIKLMRNLEGSIPLSLVINYEAMNHKAIKEALTNEWDFIVIDEVHKLRGGANYRPTQMWENFKNFKIESNAFPVMLSGSIINNQPKELWSYLHPMDPLRWPDVWEFDQMMKTGLFGSKKLMEILAPSMFRRTKADVKIKMPERIVTPHKIELDPTSDLYRIYHEMEDEMMSWLENQEGQKVNVAFKSILDQLIRLRAVLVAPGHIKVKRVIVDDNTGETTTVEEQLNTGAPQKLEYAAELMNDLLNEGQQVVVASSGFKAPLDWLYDAIDPRFKAEKLYGGNAKNGGDIAQRFRQAETQVILTNLQSGALGFNLHRTNEWPGGAEHLIMVDDWYNPELVRQQWDRVWRRGSTNRVIIHLIQVDNSVDQFVQAIREQKALNNSKITESTTLKAGDWIHELKKAFGRDK
jgi:SNF2 family DNA or RNA helicase